jgi:hypothetical protein
MFTCVKILFVIFVLLKFNRYHIRCLFGIHNYEVFPSGSYIDVKPVYDVKLHCLKYIVTEYEKLRCKRCDKVYYKVVSSSIKDY